jgi:hypothetical protein
MKRNKILIAVFLILSVLAWMPVHAQTAGLKLEVVYNDGINIDVKASIKGSSTFGLETSTLVFYYTTTSPTGALSSPTLYTTYNFSGGSYSTMTLTTPTSTQVALNIYLNNQPSTTVSTAWTDVARVRFTISNTSAVADFTWNSTPGWTDIFKDNYPGFPTQVNVDANQVFNATNNQLPVQLSSFSGKLIDQSVRLDWKTITESNSSRFEIQRSLNGVDFSAIGSVAGQGVSNTPRNYSFIDNNLGNFSNYWYRLNMINRDGTSDYSSTVMISASSLASMPQLYPTYPNPFNPQTTVHFMLPTEQAVTVSLFDASGKEVLRLYDNEILGSGYYSRILNGAQLSSGKYILRMTTPTYQKSENIVIEK